jgi:hypothetical protein
MRQFCYSRLVPTVGFEPTLDSASGCRLCELGYVGNWWASQDSNLY